MPSTTTMQRIAQLRALYGDDFGFLPWSVQAEVATLYKQAPAEVVEAFGLVAYCPDC